METLMNISLMTYLTLVAIIGTLGNGVILITYGNRWNSSKSTSVIFILILACVDLWTCLVVVPTIAIVEYREFDVPTPICRFYSFSKNLIIISSFIMSFIALDRFINIALPHCRLLNPRRVKVLLTLFIAIGIALGTLTALAFSTKPFRKIYLAGYSFTLPNESNVITNTQEVALDADQDVTLSPDIIEQIADELSLPIGANITIDSLKYKTTVNRCFADTSIISGPIREILKSTSNKVFYTLIGIVTIFYTITFVLALRRQNPRIRALKKSLNVLNKFDSYPSPKVNQKGVDSIVSIRPLSTTPTSAIFSKQLTTTILNDLNHPEDNFVLKQTRTNTNELQQYEMSNFLHHIDSDDQTLSSPTILRKSSRPTNLPQHTVSILERPSEDKLNSTKQVSFQIENRRNVLAKQHSQPLSVSTVSLNGDLDSHTDMYYKLPCPCSTTRQFLIKFHFARPSLPINKWLCCCCCCIKNQSSAQHHTSIITQNDDDTATVLTPTVSNTSTTVSNSETLRKQLHHHRIQQLRMASTFLIITVSFVLFYLPSILNAERIIKSPIMVYYLFLCTHALNPIIYCFMNPSLRTYVLTMFRCPAKNKNRTITGGKQSFFER